MVDVSDVSRESAGCDLTSNAPICGNDGECRACNENDTCAGNRRCIGGRCEICDPRDNAGCDQPDEPICDAAAGRCRGCNQGECPAGLICNDGRCSGCSLETNQNCSSETPLCRQGANGTLSCGPCTDDVPCQRFEASGQSVCVAGQCEQCDPETNRGCSGETPTCDRDTLTCIGCEPDSCNGVCVAGVCRTCDPATNQGCTKIIGRRGFVHLSSSVVPVHARLTVSRPNNFSTSVRFANVAN